MNDLTLAPSSAAQPVAPVELLRLRLGDEECAIAIRQVQELRACETPSALANTPAALLGALDLRGSIGDRMLSRMDTERLLANAAFGLAE